MSDNLQKWINEVLAKKSKNCFPLITYPGLNLINKTIIQMVTSGDIQFQCIDALAKRYPQMPAIPMSMDLSLEAEAFGSKVIFSENEIPTIKDRMLHSHEDIINLKIPEPTTPRLKEFIRAAQLANDAQYGKPVFTGCIGPYSLAGRLLDITEIMTAILMYPDEVHLLLQKTTTFIINYLKELVKTGVNGVVMAEPAAGLLDPYFCDEFSSNYIKQIADEIQTDEFIIILHNCGHTEELVESMVGTGCKAFHFGNSVDMTKILPQIPEDRIAMGNIDPANMIRTGAPEQIKEAVLNLREKTKQYNNFLLSSGCDIPPGTPLENIDALF